MQVTGTIQDFHVLVITDIDPGLYKSISINYNAWWEEEISTYSFQSEKPFTIIKNAINPVIPLRIHSCSISDLWKCKFKNS